LTCRIGVHLELGAESGARAVVAASLDAVLAGVAAARPEALPGDDEIARAVHADGRQRLSPRRVDIDLELVRDGCSGGVVEPGLNAVAVVVVAVRAGAAPGDDEVAQRVGGDARL